MGAITVLSTFVIYSTIQYTATISRWK